MFEENNGSIEKQELYELYWNQKLSMIKIAKKINRSSGYVYQKMKEFGIITRTKKEAWERYRRQIKHICKVCSKVFYVKKSRVGIFCSRACRAEYLKTLTPWNKGKPWSLEVKMKLRKKHANSSGQKHPLWQKGHSEETKKLISSIIKNKWQNIDFKNKTLEGCKKRDFKGSNNPNWKGGIEPYYGEDWYEQRQRALERDNHTCQICGVPENGIEHDVHHLIPFRLNHSNALDNLITLCRSCHMKTGHKREPTLNVFFKR